MLDIQEYTTQIDQYQGNGNGNNGNGNGGLPPKNCTSYNVRKTKSVKRGELDGKERLHTGTDYK